MANGRDDDSSILDSNAIKSGLREREKVLFRKCSCGSIWCPVCGAPKIKEKMAKVYHGWDYRYVRTYTLTIDRDLYPDGREAFFEIQRKKELAEFMRRVRKGLAKNGVQIHDYIWFLEWHNDGFPHWHFMVLINKKGKAGRIAKQIDLTETWGRAKFVKEGYVHDAQHWQALAGYVAKHGYFADGKKKQSVLPDWVREMGTNIRIKRSERMRRDYAYGNKPLRDEEITKIRSLLKTFDGKIWSEEAGDFEFVRGERTWGEYLDSCGAKCYMTLSRDRVFFMTVRLKVAYREIKALPGKYVEGQGYIAWLDKRKIVELLRNTDELIFYNEREWDDWDFDGWKSKGCIENPEQNQLDIPF